MKVRSETGADSCSGKRNRCFAAQAYLQYVEQRNVDFSCQSAEMCQSKRTFMSSRTFMNNTG